MCKPTPPRLHICSLGAISLVILIVIKGENALILEIKKAM